MAQAPSTLEISVKDDALRFSKDELMAKAGSEVVLTFRNVSTINMHNCVLVKAGTKDEVVQACAVSCHEEPWSPLGDDRIIANTWILVPG